MSAAPAERREREVPLLTRDVLSDDPVEQFRSWFEEAREKSGLRHPEAFCLSTVGPEGDPQGRIVLLKGFGEEGFVFYTNVESEKGRALAANPRAALTFHWETLGRQVRIRGGVERVSDEEADAYFRTRPRGSRLGAWASAQSRPLESRRELEEAMARAGERFGEGEVERPPFWGGYRVLPDRVEFWQDRPDRLHDRFVYGRSGTGWEISRLSP